MLPYLLKRILLFIPTLWVITLLMFLLSTYSPINPIADKCPEPALGISQKYQLECLQKEREKYRLDRPVFYFEVNSLAEPDTLFQIYNQDVRNSLERLIDKYGNWSLIQNYYQKILQLQTEIQSLHTLPAYQSYQARQLLQQALESSIRLSKSKPEQIPHVLSQLDEATNDRLLTGIKHPLDEVREAYSTVKTQSSIWKKFVPRLVWHGSYNQYHSWITDILTEGNFGHSYSSGQPITDRISSLFFWSFIFALLSTVIIYAVGIPMGIAAAAKPGGWWDRLSGTGVFALSSIPSFWLATMLLFFFANPDPDMLNWFPSSFNMIDPTFGEKISRMVLPLIAYSYGGLAFVSRSMRASLLDIGGQDFVRTAKAKGLDGRQIVFKHMLKNALLPIITIFVSVFPALVGGSVVLERIFGIPGMGNEIHAASLSNDIPMILAVFTLSGIMTLVGYLIADILYSWLDPRIKLNQ